MTEKHGNASLSAGLAVNVKSHRAGGREERCLSRQVFSAPQTVCKAVCSHCPPPTCFLPPHLPSLYSQDVENHLCGLLHERGHMNTRCF